MGNLPVGFRSAVQGAVSQHIGRQWTADDIGDMTEFACHPAAVLSGHSYSVFAKYGDTADSHEQFEVELAGLRFLSARAGVLTPAPVGIVPATGGWILVLEAVQPVERGVRHWREIGKALARIHMAKGDRFGWKTHGYFGPLHQDNTPTDSWPEFYAERRLRPGLRLAVDSGNMSASLVRQIEKLIPRVADLCGPALVPTLVHGDAQQNNFISTEAGAAIIDPAVHYGHPEMDLAMVDCWQPVPEDVFSGYQEASSIDPGFGERRDLWRLPAYLAAVTVEGTGYLGRLSEAVQRYA
jgi:protein-ribulosamine 3-kinase